MHLDSKPLLTKMSSAFKDPFSSNCCSFDNPQGFSSHFPWDARLAARKGQGGFSPGFTFPLLTYLQTQEP